MSEPTPSPLFAAILEVQKAATTLPKDRSVTVKTKTGGEYTYSYTPLDTIVEKVGPLLAANGLVWITKPSFNAQLGPTLVYKLAHAPSGEAEGGEMPLMLAEEDAQGMGSALTYMRRYALCAVLNLVAEMDDDGQRASAGGGGFKGKAASDKQVAFLRRLVTQNNLDQPTMLRLLAGVEFVLGEGEKINDALSRLSSKQCSALIDTIQNGAIPTGGSDVPSGGAPSHAPAGDTSDVPYGTPAGSGQIDAGS